MAGTDGEAVERLARDVQGVLEGRKSWIGLLGGLVSETLLGDGRAGAEENPRRRGGRDDDDDDHDDDDDEDRDAGAGKKGRVQRRRRRRRD